MIVRKRLPVKPFAILALTLALLTATATFAHVDSFGQPDPAWQQIAAAPTAKGSQVTPAGTAALDDFVSFGGLSLLLLGLGIVVTLDLATARGSWVPRADQRARGIPATDSPGEPADIMDEQTIRTIEVLPPSASGETRYVLRAALAIAFAVLLMSALDASARGNDSGAQANQRAAAQIPSATPR
jgi:hypothetical protein